MNDMSGAEPGGGAEPLGSKGSQFKRSDAIMDNVAGAAADTEKAAKPGSAAAARASDDVRMQRLHKQLRSILGEEVYQSWFNSLELDALGEESVRLSVPVKFLKTWIQTHFTDQLLHCAQAEFPGIARVEVCVREPGAPIRHATAARPVAPKASGGEPGRQAMAAPVAATASRQSVGHVKSTTSAADGSPIDPRYTFDSFVVGASNRIAQAAARQVAETIYSESRSFNPLCLHASVGLGKTHLLQAIAWEARRRNPHANVIYLTAERYRLQFIDSLRNHDPMSFKDRFRHVDALLIDDLEFLHGHQTEQEFDHLINTMLDASRPVVVASARPPSKIERMNERLRSRLQRGLVTEIQPLDQDLRLAVLQRRVAEKRLQDPSFEVPADVLELLAEKLSESGRELEGAITRLHWQWQSEKSVMTYDIAETLVRDLLHGCEPRRIKIDDIMKVCSRHFGISRADLTSQRRHRSVVWPRQIGMFLAKQLTARSLPEIGRRFGNRDHTTVLHAIRKIEALVASDSKLRAELEEIKKQLNH